MVFICDNSGHAGGYERAIDGIVHAVATCTERARLAAGWGKHSSDAGPRGRFGGGASSRGGTRNHCARFGRVGEWGGSAGGRGAAAASWRWPETAHRARSDVAARSRGAGGPDEPRGSAVGIALDVQEPEQAGSGAGPAGTSGECAQGWGSAARARLQFAGQPQDRGGERPPGSRRAIPAYQSTRAGFSGTRPASGVGRYQKEGVGG